MGRGTGVRAVLARSGRRIGVTVVGGAITFAGVVMFFLPPLPGVATILAGLALLATEYHWARRWLHRARDRFRRTSEAVEDGTHGDGAT